MLLMLIMRNLLSRPLRTLLTTMAAAMCIIAFLLLRTVSVGYATGAGAKVSNELYTRHALSILARFSVRTVDKVKRLPFVAHTSPYLIFPATSQHKAGETIGGFAVDPQEFLAVRGKSSIGIADDARDLWYRTRDGLIIGTKLVEQEHWKVGDVVMLKSPWFALPNDEPWRFTIVGIYRPTSPGDDGTALYAHYDYVNDTLDPTMRELTNGIVIECKPGTSIANAPKQVDAALAQDLPTITADMASGDRSLNGMFGAFFVLLDSLSMIFGGIVVLLLVNTITLGVRERTTHYAVMRAIGFRGPTIGTLIAGESVVLALLGSVLGCGLSDLLINRLIGPVIEANVPTIPSVHLHLTTIAFTLMAAGVFGALAGIPAFVSVMRRRLTDALRFVG
jgi:putative ABC transport system permease protein